VQSMAANATNFLNKRYVRVWPARYELLDGLRGLACILVVLHHLGVVTVGHYGVMIFFVISGYCITASVQSSLRDGKSFGEFMERRVRRIFPPYLLALAFFSATRIAKTTLDPSVSWNPTALEWLQNLTLTQWMSLPFGSASEPSQNHTLFVASFWSLNYEEQFYLVMGVAMLLIRFGVPLFITVIALLVAGLAWNIAIPDGWVSGFFLEYWAHFALGSLLYFVLCIYPTRLSWSLYVSGIVLLAAVCAVQVGPWHGWLVNAPRVYVELLALAMTSLCLAMLRPLSERISRSVLWMPVAAIGTISYSLYLVHQFNLTLVNTIVAHIASVPEASTLHVVLSLLLHIGIGAVFWRVCERPFMNKRPVETPMVVTA
jgi:peptidoglycan/LPS O-acetylase OafA/YrhL